jgi:hypothetical protein
LVQSWLEVRAYKLYSLAGSLTELQEVVGGALKTVGQLVRHAYLEFWPILLMG